MISEAKLSSCVALAAAPALLLIISVCAAFFGRTLEDGIYFRAFGPVVYLVFYGGLTYALYDFTKILIARDRFVTYSEGYIHIFAHGSVQLVRVKSITIERHLLLKNLVIRTSGGATTRVRGYMFQRGLDEVKNSIEMLAASRKRRQD